MPITDYISAKTLQQEGWVNAANTEEMYEKLDKTYLAQQGWVNAPRLRNVWLSVNKAAEVVGISGATLATYIKRGCLSLNAHGQVSLHEALTFDYEAAKGRMLDEKRRLKIGRI